MSIEAAVRALPLTTKMDVGFLWGEVGVGHQAVRRDRLVADMLEGVLAQAETTKWGKDGIA